MRLALAMVLTGLTALAGCAIPQSQYGEMTETGGVTALPLGGDRFQIEARGNGVTPADKVNLFAYLKAAEVTKSIGATHFVVIEQQNRDTITRRSLPATATTRFNGSTASTTIDQPSYSIPKPGRDLLIQAYRTNPPAGAIEADLAIQQMRALLDR